MAQLGAKFDRMDNKGRGCLQRAKNCQGGGQMLANWPQLHVTNLVESHGKCRDLEDRSSGKCSKQFRDLAGPIHKGRGRGKKSQGKGKGEGKGKGYEPQQGQAHANRRSGQAPLNLSLIHI